MKQSFLNLSQQTIHLCSWHFTYIFSLLTLNLKYFLYFSIIIFFVLLSLNRRSSTYSCPVSRNLILMLKIRSHWHSLPSEIQKIVVKFDMWSCPEPIYSSEWKSYYMIQLQEPTWFPSQRTCHQRQLWNIYYSVQKYCAGFSCSIYWKPGKIIVIFI